MSKISLLIAGKETVFYSASITYSLEQLAHTFDVQIEPMQIGSPLNVEFLLDGKSIFVGQIDTVGSSTTDSAYSINISGRSQSANMIDSRITMDASYNKDLTKLLRHLCLDFGLSVRSDVTTQPVEEFQINAESPIDNIAQIVREQGFVLIERAGTLCIEKPAGTQAELTLEAGKNIQSLSIERNFSSLFHTIEVEGAWDDTRGTATDTSINPQRKKVIIADQLHSTDACQSRADYEKGLGIANSFTASCTLPFITDELGLTQINNVIHLIDKKQNVNQKMLVRSISLSISDSEQSTALSLSMPFSETAQ